MIFFKQSLGVFIIALVLFMTACTQDNNCTPPAVEQNIIGTWTVTQGTGVVEFKTNGTFTDPDDDILGGSINNDTFSVKTYSIANDTLFTKAASPTTPNMIKVNFPIEKNECDKITISISGISGVLTRQ